MRKNRRNYYRVLHVQPDAPIEVIKASYRALMGTMRHHPDLGGDHETAALINEAYAVLTDADRRRKYDQQLAPLRERWRVGPTSSGTAGPTGSGGSGGTAGTGGSSGAGTHTSTGPRTAGAEGTRTSSGSGTRTTGADQTTGIDPSVWRLARICPMCAHALPAALRAGSRCTRCDSPLAPPPAPGGGKELLGRRASVRKGRSHAAIVYPAWNASPIAVRMRDLSMTGLSLHAQKPLRVRQAFRIVDPDFEAVAVVVSCRPAGHLYSVHASLLTVAFGKSAGVFVSATA